MSLVLDVLRRVTGQQAPDAEVATAEPATDFGSNQEANASLGAETGAAPAQDGPLAEFVGGGGYGWRMNADGSWTCTSSPSGAGVGNMYMPGDPVHDVISAQYTDVTGQAPPSPQAAGPVNVEAAATEALEAEVQADGGWGPWWDAAEDLFDDAVETVNDVVEDVVEFVDGVGDFVGGLIDDGLSFWDVTPDVGEDQGQDVLPEEGVGEGQDEEVTTEAEEHYAVVTDGNALLREGAPGFASLGTTVPLDTKVYVRETAWVSGRYTGYAKIEKVDDNTELGWTSMGNLTSCYDLDEDWAPETAFDTSDLSGTEARMAELYNEKGALIETESTRLGITAAAAAATMMAESGGRGFNADGRMIIRFENHRFWSDWGRTHPETYNQHFKYNTTDKDGDGKKEVWEDHEYRQDPEGAWVSVHASQDREWEVLNFAMELGEGSEEAAAGSISMGAGQVMGRDWHEAFGYDSAVEMLNDMQDNPAKNVGGVFSFIENNDVAKQAILDEDYVAFATQYNGGGKAEEYGGIIENYVAAWNSMMEKKSPAEEGAAE